MAVGVWGRLLYGTVNGLYPTVAFRDAERRTIRGSRAQMHNFCAAISFYQAECKTGLAVEQLRAYSAARRDAIRAHEIVTRVLISYFRAIQFKPARRPAAAHLTLFEQDASFELQGRWQARHGHVRSHRCTGTDCHRLYAPGISV